MTSMTEHLMGLNENSAQDACGVTDDIQLNCQRILACSARTLAATPGGLRFKPGSRPWLDGIASALPQAVGKNAAAGRTACTDSRHPSKAPFFGAFFHFAAPVRLSSVQRA